MALADQLNRIKKDIPDVLRRNISLSQQKKESDILFFQEVTNAILQFEQNHSDCYREYNRYFKYFTGEMSRNFRRDRLSQKENQNISQRVRLFISVLVPYAVFPYSKTLLDWVIRRFRADVHEFQHVFLFAIGSEQTFELLQSQSKGFTAQGMSEFKELTSRGYSTDAISRVLGRSPTFARIAAEALKLTVTDSCAADLLSFYAEALEHIFKREDVPDSVISVWVPALLKKRETLIQHPNGIVGHKMLRVIESLLITICDTSELIEEYTNTIRSFGSVTDSITNSDSSVSQVSAPSLPFGLMYRQYKSTNKTEEILQGEHVHSFILQLSRDCNTAEKKECISRLLEKEMRTNPTATAKLLLQGTSCLLEIAQAIPADAKTPLVASIISLLSGTSCSPSDCTVHSNASCTAAPHSTCITTQVLDELLQFLPHSRLEHALIRYTTKKDAVPGMDSITVPDKDCLTVPGMDSITVPDRDCSIKERVLMHVSPEVLMEEISGRTSWEEVTQFLSWATVKPFTRSVAAQLLSMHFPAYLDTTSSYPVYTECAYRFNEVSDLWNNTRDKAAQYIRSRIQREITQENLKHTQFLFALDQDFSLGTAISLVSVHTLLQLPKKEKLSGVKMVLRYILHHQDVNHNNPDVLKATDIFDLLEADQDAESICLFFRCLLTPGFTHQCLPDALYGIFTGTPIIKQGAKLNKMAEYIHQEHPKILPGILRKHTRDISEPQCVDMILSGHKRSAVIDLIRDRVPGLSQDAKRKILGASLELKENGDCWLFDQVVPLLPASDLFSIADTSRKDGIRLCLSAISKGPTIGQEASDASLDVLLLAWKRKLEAEEIAPAISAVIGSRTFPDLISQRLAKSGKKIQRMISLADTYLEHHKPEPLLLSCAQQMCAVDKQQVSVGKQSKVIDKQKRKTTDNTIQLKASDNHKRKTTNKKQHKATDTTPSPTTSTSPPTTSISALRDVLIRTLAKSPSTPSQVLALRVLLTCKSEEALFVSRKILENRKSSNIRYFVQSKLIRILHFVMPRALKGSIEASLILANLIRREKNLLGAYAPQLIRAVEMTHSVSLLNAMSYLEMDYLIGHLSVTRPHLIILKRTMKKRSERLLLVPEELDAALTFYLTHVTSNQYQAVSSGPSESATQIVSSGSTTQITESTTHIFAKSIAQIFVLHEQKHSIWPRIIKAFGGLSIQCLTVISRILDAEKLNPVAAPALSQVYGRMEQVLIEELKNPTEKYEVIANIMRRYYKAETDTMIDHTRILHLALERKDTTAISILPSLFSSRFRHRHSDADEMHHVLLRTLVQAQEKAGLFKLLSRIYRSNKSQVLSLLRQSAPYYSALLEHKEETVRKASTILMRRIKKYAGEDPYKYM